jgi:hypothetical protein
MDRNLERTSNLEEVSLTTIIHFEMIVTWIFYNVIVHFDITSVACAIGPSVNSL